MRKHLLKFVAFCCVLALCLGSLGVCATGTVTYGELNAKCDINQDGLVNSQDITMLVRILLGSDSITDEADVNNDGYVNLLDLVRLKKSIANLQNNYWTDSSLLEQGAKDKF